MREGATVAETIHATRVYKGSRYNFCSDKCAREFDADPAAFTTALPDSLTEPAVTLFTCLSSAPT